MVAGKAQHMREHMIMQHIASKCNTCGTASLFLWTRVMAIERTSEQKGSEASA